MVGTDGHKLGLVQWGNASANIMKKGVLTREDAEDLIRVLKPKKDRAHWDIGVSIPLHTSILEITESTSNVRKVSLSDASYFPAWEKVIPPMLDAPLNAADVHIGPEILKVAADFGLAVGAERMILQPIVDNEKPLRFDIDLGSESIQGVFVMMPRRREPSARAWSGITEVKVA
jgi:hypothetical protein